MKETNNCGNGEYRRLMSHLANNASTVLNCCRIPNTKHRPKKYDWSKTASISFYAFSFKFTLVRHDVITCLILCWSALLLRGHSHQGIRFPTKGEPSRQRCLGGCPTCTWTAGLKVFPAKHHPKCHTSSVSLVSSHDAGHFFPILMLTCTLLPFLRVDMSQQGPLTGLWTHSHLCNKLWCTVCPDSFLPPPVLTSLAVWATEVGLSGWISSSLPLVHHCYWISFDRYRPLQKQSTKSAVIGRCFDPVIKSWHLPVFPVSNTNFED